MLTKDKEIVLIADQEEKIHEIFKDIFHDTSVYHLIFAKTSDEVLQLCTTHHIDIAFIDLYLNPIHGLEVLKKIKAILPQVKVILMSYEMMIQNFRAALSFGAIDFIEKPLKKQVLEEIFKKLKNNHYLACEPKPLPINPHPFELKCKTSEQYIKFWGTRGSHTVSGSEFIRFGGNTSCLEIRTKNHLVIIDAGTGISNLGHDIIKEDKFHQIELLLGHTHLDHMAGLPSFLPLHNDKYNITIRAPINYYKNTKELLRDLLTHAFFPVDLEEVRAGVKFKELHTKEPLEIGDIKIYCHYTYHPGTTLGFKIIIGDISIGYITDNEVLMGYTGDPKLITKDHPLLEPHLDFIAFFEGCDILVHEAQYDAKDYSEKIGWGHSSFYNACCVIKHIHPKIWVVTHHDPDDTDEKLQKKYEMISEACLYLEMPCVIRMAFDGLQINL